MGRFITLGNLEMRNVRTGQTTDGHEVEIQKAERPTGSTHGIIYIRLFLDGKGISTEQFSGDRVPLADGAFDALVNEYLAPAPVATSVLTAGQKAALTRKLRQSGQLPAPVQPKAPVTSDELAVRRREAAIKAAATRKANLARSS